jgi:outer membrane protein TolC
VLGNIVVAPTAPPGVIAPGTPLVNVPLSFPVVLDQYLLQANVTVPISDYALRIGQSVAAASRSEEAAELAERAARQGAAADARLAYYGWVRTKLQQVVAEQTVVQSMAHQEAVKAAFEANRASRADVLRAESARAQAELFVERSRNATTAAEEQLATLMHDSSKAGRSGAYAVGESLAVPPQNADERAGLDALYAEAAAHRLELQALERSARALEGQRSVSDAGKLPRLDAFGNAYYANPNQRYFPQRDEWHGSWDVGLQLTWTPNDIGSASAGSRALTARAEALRAQKRALTDAIRAEILRARQGLADARATWTASQRSGTAAEEAYRVQKELYAYGKATNVELVDAETEVVRARLDAVNALVDLKVAQVRLDHALGR